MVSRNESIVESLATQAIRLGADLLEVEYSDGYEQVIAMWSGVGHDIARFDSSSPEGSMLRNELHRIAKRRVLLMVDGVEYDLRCKVWDSFGEDAFRVELRRR